MYGESGNLLGSSLSASRVLGHLATLGKSVRALLTLQSISEEPIKDQWATFQSHSDPVGNKLSGVLMRGEGLVEIYPLFSTLTALCTGDSGCD